MIVLGVVLLVALVVVAWIIGVYNFLVKKDNLQKEAWSGIDVQLKRRFDLVPNLVETVKGYAAHEKEVFQKVTEARASIGNAQSRDARLGAENALTGALKTLFAVSENYPDLRANQNFLQLQEEMSSLEDQIQMARRYYNGTARNFNTAVQTFPAVLIAKHLGYSPVEYFEVSEGERSNPQVSFS